jgi:hypothetical protein
MPLTIGRQSRTTTLHPKPTLSTQTLPNIAESHEIEEVESHHTPNVVDTSVAAAGSSQNVGGTGSSSSHPRPRRLQPT